MGERENLEIVEVPLSDTASDQMRPDTESQNTAVEQVNTESEHCTLDSSPVDSEISEVRRSSRQTKRPAWLSDFAT